jgi:hypothetical protein
LAENQELKQFDIIRLGRCVVKHVGKPGMEQPVVVFTEAISIVYSKVTLKIGLPREYVAG